MMALQADLARMYPIGPELWLWIGFATLQLFLKTLSKMETAHTEN